MIPLSMNCRTSGPVTFRDAESGKEIPIDTSNEKLRFQYKKLKAKEQLLFNDAMLKMKVDCVHLSTNKSYVRLLMDFFKRRMNRY